MVFVAFSNTKVFALFNSTSKIETYGPYDEICMPVLLVFINGAGFCFWIHHLEKCWMRCKIQKSITIQKLLIVQKTIMLNLKIILNSQDLLAFCSKPLITFKIVLNLPPKEVDNLKDL